MKKLFLISGLCLVFAGCAAKSGGDVVGNGLTAGHPMNTMQNDADEMGTCPMHKTGDAASEESCTCGHKEHHQHQKKKAKAAK